MEENGKIWTDMGFFFSFYNVLGKSVSKLSDRNLNVKAHTLLLNILIYFFSFPNWPVQKQFHGDTSSPLPCVILTPSTAAPEKLAKERAQLHGKGLT